METANEGDSGPTTYGRGYRPLLQEDPEISFTHAGERNTAPQQPVVMQNLPPHTSEPPQSSNLQQQSSSVSKIIAIQSFNTRQQSSSACDKECITSKECFGTDNTSWTIIVCRYVVCISHLQYMTKVVHMTT